MEAQGAGPITRLTILQGMSPKLRVTPADIDAQAVRSCIKPVRAVGSRAVTTIEGLSAGGSHPVQRAWSEFDVVQCGFCQPGQIMAAAAL